MPEAPADAVEKPAVAIPGGVVFRRLLGMLRPQRRLIAIGVTMLLMSVPCELFPAIVALYVVDGLILGQPTYAWLETLVSLGGSIGGRFPLLVSAVLWMTLVYVLGAALATASTNLMERVAQHFIFDLRNRIYEKLQGQSLTYLHRQRTGDLMSRTIGDVNELQGFIVNGIDSILSEGLIWLSVVAFLLYLDWRVTLAMLLPLLTVYGLLRVFNAKVAPMYKAARESGGRVSARLQENLSGIVVIKSFGRERQEAEAFAASGRAYRDDQIRAVNARTVYFPVARAMGFLSNAVMLLVGGWFIFAGSFTVGKLIAFRSVWYRLFGPVYTLARVNDLVQRSLAAGRRVFEVLDAPEDLPDPSQSPSQVRLANPRGAMALRDVTFGYHGAPGPIVLRQIDLSIDPGQTTALVGPSGGGKSTILNLLLRFYDPIEGRVTFDGHDLRSLSKVDLRRHFAFVQQESFLFARSIADNIRYARPDARDDDVVRAAQAANAHGFISETPDGYATLVGERGVRLSGGQKQRISIARAFLADPTVLLLDEPTSSVEPESESLIRAALERLMAGRTCVLTSHRPSLIAAAQRVYVVRDGRVSVGGSADEVRRQDEWFDRFMRSDDTTMTPDRRPLGPPVPLSGNGDGVVAARNGSSGWGG